MTMDKRPEAAISVSPEMASLSMGSINFGIFPLLEKYSEWKHDWEAPFLEMTKDYIFPNTFATIEYALRELGDGHGTRFEIECYDIGHLHTFAWFAAKGLIKPPFFIQMVFSMPGGKGADPAHLTHMYHTAKKLFGAENYEWSVLAAGRNQIPFATKSALQGGNQRVGLEDTIYISPRTLAKSNAEQVRKIRSIVENLGLKIATSTEARERLALKGGDMVHF